MDILALPMELLPVVAEHLDASSLLALGLASRALRHAAEQPRVWRSLLSRRHRAILDAFFEARAPDPAAGRTWKVRSGSPRDDVCAGGTSYHGAHHDGRPRAWRRHLIS